MTDLAKSVLLGAELSSLLSELQVSANGLNEETSGVNSIVSLVEKQLIGMKLGLECWLRDSSDELNSTLTLDEQVISKAASLVTELGFAKVSGEWFLAVRKVRYEALRDNPDLFFALTVDVEATKLQDASREIRITALEKLPLLIAELKERADKNTRIIVDTRKLLGL